jgi:hypothetical protein
VPLLGSGVSAASMPVIEAVARDHHLRDDFAGGEIAHQALRAGVAERAVQRAADLRGNAERAAIGFGNVDAFDFMRALADRPPGSRSSHLRVPSLEICSATTSGRVHGEVLFKFRAHVLRNVGHLGEGLCAPRTYIQCQSCCARILRCFSGCNADPAEPVRQFRARQPDQRRLGRRHIGFERRFFRGRLSGMLGADLRSWSYRYVSRGNARQGRSAGDP